MKNIKHLVVKAEEDFINKLDELSSKLGINRSELVRLSITALVHHYDTHGTLTLPIRLESPTPQATQQQSQSLSPIEERPASPEQPTPQVKLSA